MVFVAASAPTTHSDAAGATLASNAPATTSVMGPMTADPSPSLATPAAKKSLSLSKPHATADRPSSAIMTKLVACVYIAASATLTSDFTAPDIT